MSYWNMMGLCAVFWNGKIQLWTRLKLKMRLYASMSSNGSRTSMERMSGIDGLAVILEHIEWFRAS